MPLKRLRTPWYVPVGALEIASALRHDEALSALVANTTPEKLGFFGDAATEDRPLVGLIDGSRLKLNTTAKARVAPRPVFMGVVVPHGAGSLVTGRFHLFSPPIVLTTTGTVAGVLLLPPMAVLILVVLLAILVSGVATERACLRRVLHEVLQQRTSQ